MHCACKNHFLLSQSHILVLAGTQIVELLAEPPNVMYNQNPLLSLRLMKLTFTLGLLS